MKEKDIGYYPQIISPKKEEIEKYIFAIRKKYPLNKIKKILNNLKDFNVLIIGDTIIDEYRFVLPKGRAIKDPILSVDFYYSEKYLGGILAIANHVSNFVENVKLITLIGDKEDKKEFIKSNLNSNIKLKLFVKENSPTTTKIRYVNIQRKEKLFKVEHINEFPISKKLEKELITYLKKELPKHEITVVGDFGHGFLNENLIKVLEAYSNFLCINVQTNSSNIGFNYITKYHSPSFMSMDLREIQYAVQDRFSELDVLIKKLKEKRPKFNNFIITLGKRGCCYVINDKKYFSPALSLTALDTVGAGDALFALTSLISYENTGKEVVPFIGNCAGAIAANIMGNKEPITKKKLIDFIKKVYENGVE